MIEEENNLFKSFWMAGYECSDKLNAFGNRVDFLSITNHINLIDEDYKNLRRFNIATVREGIRWSKVETKPYQYNWTGVAYMIEAAKRNSIQQVWDLCHFGFPDDLTPLHPMFARRFAALCKSFVQFYRSVSPDDDLIIIPINEVSFLSWLGGEACGTSPYCKGYGWEVKYRLMKAYIEGIEAVKNEDDSVRILSSEPLINVVPPLNATYGEIEAAALQHEYQFQVTDILCGRICPELRGKPEYIDMIGLNYYYNNQGIHNTTDYLIWKDVLPDKRWKPLHVLIDEVYTRYNKPIAITETSHPKEDRPLWIEMIGKECEAVLKAGIPLKGICIYPVIDRPDWDDLITWHRSGIWDIEADDEGLLQRVLNIPFAEALKRVQVTLDAGRKSLKRNHFILSEQFV
jgi:beta-glucosidase/6-phospho-beta-glucosidase/beta-galactosidase